MDTWSLFHVLAKWLSVCRLGPILGNASVLVIFLSQRERAVSFVHLVPNHSVISLANPWASSPPVSGRESTENDPANVRATSTGSPFCSLSSTGFYADRASRGLEHKGMQRHMCCQVRSSCFPGCFSLLLHSRRLGCRFNFSFLSLATVQNLSQVTL